MAKESTDNVTIDLFHSQRRPGRPRTNPLTRAEQMKLNKRRQIKRDKSRGLRRIELKVDELVYTALNKRADAAGLSRSQLIEQLLTEALANTTQDV